MQSSPSNWRSTENVYLAVLMDQIITYWYECENNAPEIMHSQGGPLWHACAFVESGFHVRLLVSDNVDSMHNPQINGYTLPHSFRWKFAHMFWRDFPRSSCIFLHRLCLARYRMNNMLRTSQKTRTLNLIFIGWDMGCQKASKHMYLFAII